MAYDEALAERIGKGMARRTGVAEKKMFGGIGYLLNGNMCVGVWKDFLIVRLDPGDAEKALTEAHVQEFSMGGRTMKGWVLVAPEGVKDARQLTAWIARAAKYVDTLPAK
jgi:TfoX/Sxy family transcriptional regulator of competence genes